MAIRLHDIAARANVATSTVSRVLNGYPYVSPTTREAVWRAAQEMGIDVRSRRRGTRQSSTIILTDMCRTPDPWASKDEHTVGSEFARQVLAGAQAAMTKCGRVTDMQLVSGDTVAARLCRSQRGGQPADTNTQSSDNGEAAGYLLIGGDINYTLVQRLQDACVPFVIVGARPEGTAADCVMADYVGGVEQAVHHLVQAGRRRIGLVKGSPSTLTSHEKYKGFRLALCQRNLPFTSQQAVEAESFTPEAAGQPTQELVEHVKGLDAIIYGDDYLAMGGIHTIKHMGLRVPDDVAVIGFHDYRIAPFTDPSLTTVRIDGQQMGAMAAQRLYMLLDMPASEPWIVIAPTTLIVRASA